MQEWNDFGLSPAMGGGNDYITIWLGPETYRPDFNAYMVAGAWAIGEVASMAGEYVIFWIGGRKKPVLNLTIVPLLQRRGKVTEMICTVACKTIFTVTSSTSGLTWYKGQTCAAKEGSSLVSLATTSNQAGQC